MIKKFLIFGLVICLLFAGGLIWLVLRSDDVNGQASVQQVNEGFETATQEFQKLEKIMDAIKAVKEQVDREQGRLLQATSPVDGGPSSQRKDQ